jgi:hypothetical protein
MLVTVLEATGDKKAGIEGLQCRAVPFILVPVEHTTIATQEQQVGWKPLLCAGDKCMQWCWESSTPPGQERRGFCGLSGP